MKLKCIIVDDEPMARKVLEEYIEETERKLKENGISDSKLNQKFR